MSSPLPRVPPCCSRLTKASQSLSPTQQYLSSGRACSSSHHPRRFTVNAFLFNPSANGNSRTKEAITNRLSELRSRSEEEDRAFINARSSSRGADNESDDEDLRPNGSSGPRGRPSLGPWPVDSTDEEGIEGGGQGVILAGAGAGAAVTPRSLRYLMSDPKPEIKLLHRFKPGQGPDNDFWRSFMDKCRLAWGVFFPPALTRRPTGVARWAGNISRLLAASPSIGLTGASSEGSILNGRSAKQVVLSRLQMVLIADRCGVSPEQLLEMKAQTLTALAEYMGEDLKDDMSQLEVQVSALKPNGERITMTIGFADMLGDEQLRDPLQYHYEFEDDDDYFFPDEDDGRVAEIAEAPAAGLQAARVVAKPVPRSSSTSPAKTKADES